MAKKDKDKTFKDATLYSPAEGRVVQGWHGSDTIACRKIRGNWEFAAGPNAGKHLVIEGWREWPGPSQLPVLPEDENTATETTGDNNG